jgi:3-oxoadipate enol-lactonase
LTGAALAGAGPRVCRIGGVHVAVVGDGLPVTVFAHGLAGSSAESRPLAARTPGTRLLLTFRGHGVSEPLTAGWTYDDLADDLAGVADAFAATRAVGLSVGAGALLRLLSRDPDRFDRLAFLLPAALDETRADPATDQLLRLADAVIAGDEAAVVHLLLADVPPSVRARVGTRLLLGRRARALMAGAPPYPRGTDAPLAALEQLTHVHAPAVVITQDADALHPADVGARLAASLPDAELLQLPPGGVFWTATRQVQDVLAAHLALEIP